MIHLLTGPVRSGKTTTLLNWVEGRGGVGGFLCPDAGGTRKLYEIGPGRWHPFQLDGPGGGDSVRVGRFAFDRSAFDLAGRIVEEALSRGPELIVVDEVGKLELGGSGFAGVVRAVITAHDSGSFPGDLLLVVRQSCLRGVIARFGIDPFRVLGPDHFRGMGAWTSTARRN